VSPFPRLFLLEGTDCLFDSETGEFKFSPTQKNFTWYENQNDASFYDKLNSSIERVLKIKKKFVINTPPPPSPTFLPRVYALQQLALSDLEYFDKENGNFID